LAFQLLEIELLILSISLAEKNLMQFRWSYLFSISLLALGFGSAAHATPITAGSYELTGTTITAGSTAYSLTGTVTVGSNGLFTAADITLNDAALGDPVFDVISSTGGPAGFDPVADFAYVTTAGNSAQLYLSYLTTLNGSGNINLCTVGGSCNGYQDSYGQVYAASAFGFNPVDLNGGTFDTAPVTPPVAVTPEPASLALLGIGIVAVATAVYKWRKKGQTQQV
jgi:PEP-CTERM motif